MPPTDVLHRVPRKILVETRDFLYERGLEGCEGTLLWIGEASGNAVEISRILVPEQICRKSAFGVAVDLTERAHYTLPDHLRPGERFYVRVHSHPGRAYHSARDSENAVITHQGALSVVVPDFARQPIRLEQCAVYRLEHGKGWLKLGRDDIGRVFEVCP